MFREHLEEVFGARSSEFSPELLALLFAYWRRGFEAGKVQGVADAELDALQRQTS